MSSSALEFTPNTLYGRAIEPGLQSHQYREPISHSLPGSSSSQFWEDFLSVGSRPAEPTAFTATLSLRPLDWQEPAVWNTAIEVRNKVPILGRLPHLNMKT